MEGPRKLVLWCWWLLRWGVTGVRSPQAHLLAWIHLASACRARTWQEAPSSSRSVCDRTPRTIWGTKQKGRRRRIKKTKLPYQSTTDKLTESFLNPRQTHSCLQRSSLLLKLKAFKNHSSDVTLEEGGALNAGCQSEFVSLATTFSSAQQCFQHNKLKN